VESIRDYDDNHHDNEDIEMLFNSPITYNEITESVKVLNCNKASAGELIPRHFKYEVTVLLLYICKYFNRLFTYAEFPSSWAKFYC